MKHLRTVMRAVFCATLTLISATAAYPAAKNPSKTVDDGGSGPYKAIITADSHLDGYSIIRPADIASASAVEGPLPVVLFGNGGCSRNADGFHRFLVELASHGYVCITNGLFYYERSKDNPAKLGEPEFETASLKDAKDYLNALDWLQAQTLSRKSEYYGRVDCSNVAAMGQSCGGIQALILGASGDPRIRTTVALNSGLTSPGDMLAGMMSKADLPGLSNSVIYIIGGKSDIAYKNAIGDFQLIDHIPVTIANLEVGHGGTYGQPNGGAFAKVALAWLEYRLRGRDIEKNEKLFRYCQVPADLPGWKLVSRNYSPQTTISLPYASRPDIEEGRDIDDFGRVANYTRVTEPSITVSLPDPDKATGTAVLLFPGGGLSALSWVSDFHEMADFLNSRGIAAIGVKYRTRTGARPAAPSPGSPRPAAPRRDTTNKFLMMRARITDFGDLVKANCNPAPTTGVDESIENSVSDALHAIELVRSHASEWGIDPAKVGFLGFSAGGGVEIEAAVRATPAQMPSFIGTVYGPALADVTVPKDAPALFIAVHDDHPNVAAGCLALYLEWEKAGAPAELHVYGDHTGGMFSANRTHEPDCNPSAGSWLEQFHSWLVSNKF